MLASDWSKPPSCVLSVTSQDFVNGFVVAAYCVRMSIGNISIVLYNSQGSFLVDTHTHGAQKLATITR